MKRLLIFVLPVFLIIGAWTLSHFITVTYRTTIRDFGLRLSVQPGKQIIFFGRFDDVLDLFPHDFKARYIPRKPVHANASKSFFGEFAIQHNFHSDDRWDVGYILPFWILFVVASIPAIWTVIKCRTEHGEGGKASPATS